MSEPDLLEQLETLLRTGLAAIEHAVDDAAIEGWRVDFLGRNGQLAQLMKQLGSISPEDRPKAVDRANEVKRQLEATFAARAEAVRQDARSTAPATVRMGEVASTLGEVLRRPALIPVPLALLRIPLGEFAELLSPGQRVGCERALASGKTESLAAGRMGLGTSDVGDLIAGNAGERPLD